MPVVGLIVTLPPDPVAAAGALDWLRADPRFLLGPLDGDRLAAVLDTPDRAADDAAWEALGAVPGLLHAEPVYADLSDCISPREPK